MNLKPLFFITLVVFTLPAALGAGQVQTTDNAFEFLISRPLTPKEQLGMRIFFDTKLSRPAGQACASCHTPSFAFTDPDQGTPTSQGVNQGLFGSRNSPTAMYAAFSPAFHYDDEAGLYQGGQFLDGRAATLEDQAKAPLLNPLEMANPDKQSVVDKVNRSSYARLFQKVYGKNAFEDPELAYDRIAEAIATFERTESFNRFSSKYDAWLAGKVRLTTQEQHGLALYEGKAGCSACHPNRSSADDRTPPLFTDFSYDNLGVPKNPDNRFYTLPASFNPQGKNFVDQGLGGFVGLASEEGKFKVPTLRNIALTPPYMHNGYFKTLRGVVAFYNSRDAKPACPNDMTTEDKALKMGCWPAAELPYTVNHGELGNLGLNDTEINDVVAFLNALTDGWRLGSIR